MPEVCFKYVYVDRGEGVWMSVVGVGFLDTREISKELVNFYFVGVVDKLDCVKVNASLLDCGDSYFVLGNYDDIDSFVWLDEYYSDNIVWNVKDMRLFRNVVSRVCGGELVCSGDFSCVCGDVRFDLSGYTIQVGLV
jgi:hypothetical protein